MRIQVILRVEGRNVAAVREELTGTAFEVEQRAKRLQQRVGCVMLEQGLPVACQSSAQLTPKQKVSYPELEDRCGVVRGECKPPYVGGTQIPSGKVDFLGPESE